MNKKTFIVLILFPALLLSLSCATTPASGTKVRLLVNQIKTEKGTPAETAEKVEKQLIASLKKLRGEECRCILYYKERNLSLSANRHLAGTLTKFKSSLFLSLRIIDGEKSRILFSTSKIIRENKDLEEIVEETAEEIHNRKNVWQ